MCADVIKFSPNRKIDDDDDEEENEEVRLRSELDRLIQDELDVTQFDLRCEAYGPAVSNNWHQNETYSDNGFVKARSQSDVQLCDTGASSGNPHHDLPDNGDSHEYSSSNRNLQYCDLYNCAAGQQRSFEAENSCLDISENQRLFGSNSHLPNTETASQPIEHYQSDQFMNIQSHYSSPNLNFPQGHYNDSHPVVQSGRQCFTVNGSCDFVSQPVEDASSGPASSYETELVQNDAASLIHGNLEMQARMEERSRECLIFEARGRQLQETREEVAFLKEEIARCERLSQHKEILAKAEIENLTQELANSETLRANAEKKVAELTQANSNLTSELDALKELKKEVERKLADVEATNATLSAELVQLSNTASLNLAKQRENNLAECLARRHAMAEDDIREQLEATQRRLTDKVDELAALKKELEAERRRGQEMSAEHAELVESLQEKLKVAQDRCYELSSSSLCIEVHDLKERIREIFTSKKITDDINEILQEELRDVREQLALYEQRLGLQAGGDIPDGNEAAKPEVSGLDPTTPRQQLPVFHDTGGVPLSTIRAKPTAAQLGGRRRGRSCQSVTFATHLAEEADDGDVPQRPASALPMPLSSTLNQDSHAADNFGLSDDEAVSTIPSRRSALGPTPGGHSVGPGQNHTKEFLSSPKTGHVESVETLQAELKAALASYRAKCAQITSLQEKFFAVRCELHKTESARDRAESARAELQVRVLALEKELNLQGDIRKPGPRESALAGQLERLQADYSRLENDLQTTRQRLQDALAGEARAAAAERTARAAAEAGAAEGAAAVERARAACEAAHAAARRRLEASLAAEHERALAELRRQVATARAESEAYQGELEKLNRLLQEAKGETAQAVQMALAESMKERENERIRFWREELPRQIDQARRSWMSEAETRSAIEVERLQTEFQARMDACIRKYQEEIDALLQPKPTCDVGVGSVPAMLVPNDYPVLSVLLSEELFSKLSTIPDAAFLLPSVETHLSSLLRLVTRALAERVVDDITKSIITLLSRFDAFKGHCSQYTQASGCSTVCDATVQDVLNVLEGCSSMNLSPLVNLVGKVVEESAQLHTTWSDTQRRNLATQNAVIARIRGEVKTYAASVQERCAQALQNGLVQAHRRACRQFSRCLRNALTESCRPSTSTTVAETSPLRLTKGQLESLLHLIDTACASTEAAFSTPKVQPMLSSDGELPRTKPIPANRELRCTKPRQVLDEANQRKHVNRLVERAGDVCLPPRPSQAPAPKPRPRSRVP